MLIGNALGVFVEPAVREVFVIEHDVDVVDFAKLTKLDRGELDARRSATTEDVHIGDL